MPSDKPRLNVVSGLRLRADLEALADARETSISQLTRDALLHIVAEAIASA
jgi:hypothetical protein